MGLNRFGQWFRSHPVRFLFYTSALATVVMLFLVLPRLFCSKGNRELAGLINLPLVHRWSESVGIRFRLKSFKVECESNRCLSHLRIEDLEIELLGTEPAQFHLGILDLCLVRSVLVQNLTLGTSRRPDLLSAGEVRFDIPSSEVRVAQARFRPNESYTLVAIEQLQYATAQISGTGLHLLTTSDPSDALLTAGKFYTGRLSSGSNAGNAFRLESLSLEDIDVFLQRGNDGVQTSARLQGLCPPPDDLNVLLRTLVRGGQRLAASAKRSVGFFLPVVVVLVLLLKLLVTGSVKPWTLRVLAVLLPVLVSLAINALLTPSLSLSSLIAPALAVVAAGVVAYLFIYRKASEWHQRWEPFAIDILSPLLLLPVLIANGWAPPSLPSRQLSDVAINTIQLQDTKAWLRETAASPTQALVDIPRINLKNLRLRLDPNSGQVQTAEIEKLSGQGIVESSLLGQELEGFRYVPASWKGPQRVGLCFDVRSTAASGPQPTSSAECPQTSQTVTNLSLGAVLHLAPAQCRLVEFTSSARLSTAALDVTLEAQGNTEQIAIRNLHSLTGSGLRIREGQGTVTLAQPLRAGMQLRGIASEAGGIRTAVSSVILNASVSADSSQGNRMGLKMVFHEIERKTSDGSDTRIDEWSFLFDRSRSNFSLRNELSQITAVSRDPLLSADFPRLVLDVTGSASSERLPGHIQGKMFFALSNERSEANLRTADPIQFSLDSHRGILHCPPQFVNLRQAIISQLPQQVPLRLSLAGDLESLAPRRARLESQIQVAALDLPIQRIEIGLNDLQAKTSVLWKGDETVSKTTIRTGFNRIRFPAFSQYLEFRDLSQLNAGLQGHTASTGSLSQLFQDLPSSSTVSPTFTLPEMSDQRVKFDATFESGHPPTIRIERIENESGKGVQVRQLATRLKRLVIREAKLSEVESATDLTGIQTLENTGNLNLHAESHITGERSETSLAIVPAADPESPFAAKIQQEAETAELSLTQALSLKQFFPQVTPFLKHFDVGSDGTELKAEITKFQTRTQFSGKQLKNLDLQLEVAPGPLVVVDWSRLPNQPTPRPWQTLDVALKPQAAQGESPLNLKLGLISGGNNPSPLEVALDAGSLTSTLTAPDGQASRLDLDLAATANFLLHHEKPSQPAPILDHLVALLRGLEPHVEKASQVFETTATSGPSVAQDVSWGLSLKNLSPQLAVLEQRPDRLALRIRTENGRFQSGDSNPDRSSRIEWEGDVSLDMVEHQEHLLVDGYLPFHFSRWDAAGIKQSKDVKLPVLAAFAEKLRPAPSGSGLLWDSEYYQNFWSTYTPLNARFFPSILETSELNLGPASLQQISFPSQPLRLVLGYKDRLQLHVPLSAAIGFGRADGIVQADLTWSDRQAELCSRVKFDLTKFQASAVGLFSPEGHVPFLQDELSGKLAFSTEDLRLDSHILEQLQRDPDGFNQFDHLGLNLRLQTDPNANAPSLGLFQFSTDAQVNLLNKALNRIIRDLQLSAAPSALAYKQLSVSIQAEQGKVKMNEPFLKIQGLRVPASNLVDLETNLSVHWGRKELGFDEKGLGLRDVLTLFR